MSTPPPGGPVTPPPPPRPTAPPPPPRPGRPASCREEILAWFHRNAHGWAVYLTVAELARNIGRPYRTTHDAFARLIAEGVIHRSPGLPWREGGRPDPDTYMLPMTRAEVLASARAAKQLPDASQLRS